MRKPLLFGALFLLGSWMSSAQAYDVRTYVPVQAPQYLPMLKAEIQRAMPEHRQPSYFGGLVEQESCISLTHRRCWNPKSRLKTAREEGAGLGQITRAYYSNGRLRFDALAEHRRTIEGLDGLNWGNVYERPQLQLRLMVGMVKRCDSQLKTRVPMDAARYQMCDAAYNGGLGGLMNERRACQLTKGCNPNLWFAHVERHCLKSRRALYGQRSACDINREHVRSVFGLRRNKYKPYLGGDA
jgi:hypothetical protein